MVTQSPEDIPPIDPRAVLELELYARRVASSLDQMMINLNTNLHKVSDESSQHQPAQSKWWVISTQPA